MPTRSTPRPNVRSPQALYGFTLVELLVVITIIAVLLSLLAPAMDKAIYQAELAVCAANLHAIAAGAQSYAMGNKRQYPYRNGARGGEAAASTTGTDTGAFNRTETWFPNLINGGSAEYDHRPGLREFLSLNGHLNDPLMTAVDLDGSDQDAWISADYNLYFGTRYFNQQTQRFETGMFRLGDRWSWSVPDASGGSRTDRFTILAADQDQFEVASNISASSHPDADGKMSQVVHDNDLGVAGAMFATGSSVITKATYTLWVGRKERGHLDTNYAFSDGSVERYRNVRWNEADLDSGRMVKVALYLNGAFYPFPAYTQVPRR